MLTGQRPIAGETISDTLIEVATKEPDRERIPARARRLLRRCLEKDPRRRLRDIGDAWFWLEDAPPEVPPSNEQLVRGVMIVLPDRGSLQHQAARPAWATAFDP